MALPQAADALCAKADQLKIPALHATAVEAQLAARGGGPPDELWPMLLDQVRQAWNDRDPWPLRLRLVLALRAEALDAPELWLALASLVNGALAEPPPPGAWSPEQLRQAQAAARDFARRAGQD